ncbi:MAG: sulfatase-like hydrolase/transferase [Solirubrobacterales bacterium]|nr:sulfatase-like hydrolase/transferase [Solirubrobacterales bacterium]HMT04323.1 sulfatase-like hydrolase/transferase [Solirubrobacterales bacterium]
MSDPAGKDVPLQPPSLPIGGLHLAALWALAIVQPLLSLLGKNPDFFVARDDTAAEIIIFVLLLTFLPPLVATAIEVLLNVFSRTVRWFFHLTLCAVLLGAISLQVLKLFSEGPGLLMILLALLLGCLLAAGYAKVRFFRSMADILIIAPPVIVIAFLFFSQVSELTISTPEVKAKEITASNPAPVLMVIFDEFPAGSLMTPSGDLNQRRFPNFGLLERTGTWYRNTVTDASYTAIAVPSILTGQAADRDALPTAADHPDSLFTLLGNQWKTRAIEPITRLCPEGVCEEGEASGTGTWQAVGNLADDLRHVSAHLLLPESMESSLPDISQSFQGFGGEPEESIERGRARQWVRDRLDEGESSVDGEGDVERFLTMLEPVAGPTFDFVHIEEPHYPWTHYPSGLRYSDGTEDFRAFFDEKTWHAPPYVTDRAGQAHLLEVGFADNLLGRIISVLKREGRFNETLIVVTADHGGATSSGFHRREASPETMGQVGMVPLFIKAPNQRRGAIVDRPTCSTEIVPKVAGLLGIRLPWEPATCDRKTVKIDNGTGPAVTLPFTATIAQRDRYINRLAGLFGGSTGWNDVLKLGPFRGLIGSAPHISKLGPVTGTEVRPDTPSPGNSTFDPSVELNPVLRQRGRISGLPDGTPLAVTVNGKVAATGQVYTDSGQTMYSILIPVWSLKQGENEITLNQITGRAGQPARGPGGPLTLRPLRASDDE